MRYILTLILAMFAITASAQTTVTLVPQGPSVAGVWAARCYAGTCTAVPNSEGSAVNIQYALPSPWSAGGAITLTYNGQAYSAPTAGAYTLQPFTNGQYIQFNGLQLTHASGATMQLDLRIYDHFARCGGRGSALSCNAQHIDAGAFSY